MVALNWGLFEGMVHCMLQQPRDFQSFSCGFIFVETAAGYLKHRVPTRGKLKLQDPTGDTHATRFVVKTRGEMGKVVCGYIW